MRCFGGRAETSIALPPQKRNADIDIHEQSDDALTYMSFVMYYRDAFCITHVTIYN